MSVSFNATIKRWVPPWQRRRYVHTFIKKLSMLLNSGVLLTKGLYILSENAHKKRGTNFYEIIKKVAYSVESGRSFHESIGRFSKWFPPMVVSLIQVGEESGRLKEVTLELKTYMDSQDKYLKKVTSSLAYPMVVICIAVLTVIFLIMFLLPTFSSMYEDMGMDLPVFTQILLNIGNRFAWFILGTIITVAAIGFIFRKLMNYDSFRGKIIKLFRRMPFIGSVLNQVIIVYYLQILITLQESGLTLLKSLEVCRTIARSSFTNGLFQYLIRRLKDGQSFSDLITRTNLIDPEFGHIFSISEETGEFLGAFRQIHEAISIDMETRLESLSALLEPVIIVGLGLLVGAILVGMYLPIFELSSTTAF